MLTTIPSAPVDLWQGQPALPKESEGELWSVGSFSAICGTYWPPEPKPEQVEGEVSGSSVEQGRSLSGLSASFRPGQVVIEALGEMPLLMGQPPTGALSLVRSAMPSPQARWSIVSEMASGAIPAKRHEGFGVQEAPSPKRLIEEIDGSAQPLLTSSIKQLLPILKAVILTKANSARVPLRGFRLRAFQDPEEGWKELIIEVRVEASPQQALAFWDSVGDALDRLKAHLPSDLVSKLHEGVAIHIEWH